MTIKIKLRTDLKATLRFADKREMDFFRFIMLRMRDDPSNNHPPVSIKDPNGKEAPKLMMQKPLSQTQPNPTEAPIIVQATPLATEIKPEIQVKPEIKCYTKADLVVGGKLQCSDCTYNDAVKSTCQRGQPSENYYHDFNGNILGCPEGERRTSV